MDNINKKQTCMGRYISNSIASIQGKYLWKGHETLATYYWYIRV